MDLALQFGANNNTLCTMVMLALSLALATTERLEAQSSLTLLNTYIPNWDDVVSIAISGDNLYLGGTGTELNVLDISNPVGLVFKGQRFPPFNCIAGDMAVSGTHAYMTCSYFNFLRVLDVSHSSNIAQTGDIPIGNAFGVCANENYAFVSSWGYSLLVIDVRDPSNPIQVGGCLVPATHLALDGNYVYTAFGESGKSAGVFSVVDVGNPLTPLKTGICDLSVGGRVGCVAVNGHYAYVGTSVLDIVDVSNPANPLHVGTYSGSGAVTGIAFAGRYAYAASASGLDILDLSQPANPVLVSRGPSGPNGPYVVVAVRSDRVYAANQYELALFSCPIPRLSIGVLPDTSKCAIQLESLPLAALQLLSKTNLNDPWSPLVSVTNATGTMTLTNLTANPSQCFYTVRQAP